MKFVSAASTNAAAASDTDVLPPPDPTTYKLMGTAMSAAGRHAVSLRTEASLSAAVSEELQAYVGRHYQALVLRPALQICWSFYQVATLVPSLYAVPLPSSIASMLTQEQVIVHLNFDSIEMPLQCVGLGGFMPKLVVAMVGPLVLMALAPLVGLWLELGVRADASVPPVASSGVRATVRWPPRARRASHRRSTAHARGA